MRILPRQVLALYTEDDRWQHLHLPVPHLKEAEESAQESEDVPVHGIAVQLPGHQLLTQSCQLPWRGRAATEAMVRVQVESASPFPAEDQVWAWTRLPGEDQDALQKVVWVLTRRAEVDACLQRAPLPVTSQPPEIWVHAAGQWLHLPGEAPRKRLRQQRRRLRLLGSLLTMTALLLCLLILSPVIQKRVQVLEMNALSQAWQDRAAPALEARQTLSQGLDRADYLRRISESNPDAIRILDRLSDTVPDDGWLERLDVRAERILVSGRVDNAAALQQALEDLPLFSSVRATSAIAREPQTGKERFSFEMEYVP